jgi:Tfp pilus assembly protein PilO
MRTRESIWRQRAGLLVVAGIFFAANLAFLMGSRSITAARRQALEERRTALSRDVTSREAEAAKLGGQRDRLAQISSVIDEFYGRRVGSRRETLAPIVEEVHAVMLKVGVAPTAISYSTASFKTLPLSQMLIGFHFDSDYARFKRLLAAFEANRRWIVVREVSLNRKTDVPGEVQVALVLATYFSGDESVPAPPAPASPSRRTVRAVERTVER